MGRCFRPGQNLGNFGNGIFGIDRIVGGLQLVKKLLLQIEDSVIIAIEMHQLPAPDFRVPGDNTVAVLFAPRGFGGMDRDERVRACYQHACLMYVSGKRMTNATLRERLGIKASNYPMASRIIKDTISAELIRLYEGSGISSYLPFWA